MDDWLAAAPIRPGARSNLPLGATLRPTPVVQCAMFIWNQCPPPVGILVAAANTPRAQAPCTALILRRIVPTFRRRGYRFCTACTKAARGRWGYRFRAVRPKGNGAQQPCSIDQAAVEEASPGTLAGPILSSTALEALDQRRGPGPAGLPRIRQRPWRPPFQPSAPPSLPSCPSTPTSAPGHERGLALGGNSRIRALGLRRGPCRPHPQAHQASGDSPAPWWIPSRQPGRRGARGVPAPCIGAGCRRKARGCAPSIPA